MLIKGFVNPEREELPKEDTKQIISNRNIKYAACDTPITSTDSCEIKNEAFLVKADKHGDQRNNNPTTTAVQLP